MADKVARPESSKGVVRLLAHALRELGACHPAEGLKKTMTRLELSDLLEFLYAQK